MVLYVYNVFPAKILHQDESVLCVRTRFRLMVQFSPATFQESSWSLFGVCVVSEAWGIAVLILHQRKGP